jgi:phosphatidylinositol glycan class M
VAIVSARGSADSLVLLLVLLALWLHQRRHLVASAAVLGLAAHWRLYPAIYLPSLFFALMPAAETTKRTENPRKYSRLVTPFFSFVRRAFANVRGHIYVLVGI